MGWGPTEFIGDWQGAAIKIGYDSNEWGVIMKCKCDHNESCDLCFPQRMNIYNLTRIDQIKEGDILLIFDGKEILHETVNMVKVSEQDGTEVIFNKSKNKFFNVGMYLDGKSWAKDIRVVRIGV